MSNNCFVKPVGKNIGVYLHWNGGRDSIEAFLEYCKLKQYPPFETDYGMARFVQTVANFFGTGTSIGIEEENSISTCNGTYVIKGWEIVSRDFNGEEQHNYSLKKMLEEIDQEQPAAIQLGCDFLHAEIIDAKDLQIGDTVYWIDCKNTVNTNHIVGHNSKGFYMDRYSNKYDVEPYDWNNNNYVKGKVRVERKKAEEV